MPHRPRWGDILQASYVHEDNCWESCGGYCCDIRHDGCSFRLLPAEGTSLLVLGDEYDWMRSGGHLPDAAGHREIAFDFGGPAPLRLVAVDCKLKGACRGVALKPLHCRLYPFLPVFDVHGGLADVVPASIFDLTLLARTGKAACSLWETRRDHYLETWRRDDSLRDLRHPLIMFSFAVYKRFADNYMENLRRCAPLAGLEGPSFWLKWELFYLGRKLFDLEAMRAAALETYGEFATVHGDFLGGET